MLLSPLLDTVEYLSLEDLDDGHGLEKGVANILFLDPPKSSVGMEATIL
jgi:hypothetical protein